MDSEIQDVLEGRKRWAVVCANCLDVLPTLPSGVIGSCVTDPPYGVQGSSGTINKLRGKADYAAK